MKKTPPEPCGSGAFHARADGESLRPVPILSTQRAEEIGDHPATCGVGGADRVAVAGVLCGFEHWAILTLVNFNYPQYEPLQCRRQTRLFIGSVKVYLCVHDRPPAPADRPARL